MSKKRKKKGLSERERKRRALQSLKDGNSEVRTDALRHYHRRYQRGHVDPDLD